MIIVRYQRREEPLFRERTGNFVPVSISIKSNYELHWRLLSEGNHSYQKLRSTLSQRRSRAAAPPKPRGHHSTES